MNLKLIFLLCLLPVFFFVPYYYSSTITGNTGLTELPGLQANKIITSTENGYLKNTQNVYKDSRPTTINEERYDKEEYEISSDQVFNKTVNYYIQKPEQPWPSDIKFPLIVHLHDQNNFAISGNIITKPNMAYTYPAFNLAPTLENGQIFSESSQDGMDVSPEFVSHLVKSLIQQYPIDKNRIYIVGCGHGALGAFNEIDNNRGLYAGIIAINGAPNKISTNIAQTPILMMQGSVNKKFATLTAKSFVSMGKKAGAKISYKEFDSMGHTCSYKDFYGKNVWDWLFKQRKIKTDHSFE